MNQPSGALAKRARRSRRVWSRSLRSTKCVTVRLSSMKKILVKKAPMKTLMMSLMRAASSGEPPW